MGRQFSRKYYFLFGSLAFLVVGLLLHGLWLGKSFDEAEYVNEIQGNFSKQVLQLQKEMIPVIEKLENDPNTQFTHLQTPTDYSFYVFDKGQMVFWSDYRYVPAYRYLRGNYEYKFIKTLRKNFVSRRWRISGTNYEIFALIPIYYGFKVDNNYVKSEYNTEIFRNQNVKVHESYEEIGYDICFRQKGCLFKVSLEPDYGAQSVIRSGLFIGLLSISIILFVIFIILLTESVAKAGVELGLLLLITLLLLVRLPMLYFRFPANFIDTWAFDSRFFASSFFNPSFGDLIANLVCLTIISVYIFRHFRKSVLLKNLLQAAPKLKIIWMVIVSGLSAMVHHGMYLLFQTVYHNSQITYDINETIKFDVNRSEGFIIFVLLAVNIFLCYHVMYRLMERLVKSKTQMLGAFFSGLVLFGVINFLINQNFWQSALVSICLFIVLYLTKLPYWISQLRYKTFLYLFTSIIATSVLASLAIFEFENERETARKRKFAEQFLIENDDLGEYLLSEINDKIKSDVFIQARMAGSFLSKDIVKSKIRQKHLSRYFDKYDTRIYIYNSSGKPFDNRNNGLTPKEVRAFNIDEFKTVYPDIYFVNKFGTDVSKRYLSIVEIKRRGILVGYVVLDLKLKRIIPENVYPELLVDNRFLFPFQHRGYSYAVFSDEEITYHSGNFNYYTSFSKTLLKRKEIYKNGLGDGRHRHLAFSDQEGRTIVITSNSHRLSDAISNFSFLFLILIFTVLIFSAGYAMYFSFQNVSLNYSAKIQLYLNIAFFLPLFVVSVTTLSLINRSFRKEVNDEYYKKARNISTNISVDLKDYVDHITEDSEELPNKLAEIAKFASADVNLFSTGGKLIASSQPVIYENDILSKYINPDAMSKIKEQGENAYITRESVGTLEFNTTFFGVKAFDTGDLIGIISVPFFQSEYTLEQNEIDILANVINIFSLIFIVFLIISYLAAKWLTFPLTFITQKLKKTTLTGFNEPLSWKTDDEIGMMVGEYNRMLINLDESKRALARSQKESAWREMAQQVAHEIKNPLTPMKLTLQHLSRKLLGTAEQGDFEKPIGTLLHQVDTLNDIASSFSSFAKMPMPEHERYEISSVLKKTVALYTSTENVSISLALPPDEVYTMGDEQLMGRIVSNVMLNSIQAREEEKMKIDLKLSVEGNNKIQIELQDDGRGIDDEIYSKIFIPNFTTKETGSGIGLAIAKHGIEHAGGKIWFESELDKGTTFYIELPKVD